MVISKREELTKQINWPLDVLCEVAYLPPKTTWINLECNTFAAEIEVWIKRGEVNEYFVKMSGQDRWHTIALQALPHPRSLQVKITRDGWCELKVQYEHEEESEPPVPEKPPSEKNVVGWVEL